MKTKAAIIFLIFICAGCKVSAISTISANNRATNSGKLYDPAGNDHDDDDVPQESSGPTAPGSPTSFALLGDDLYKAELAWTSAGNGKGAPLLKQQILFFENNSTCTGTPADIVDISPAAISYIWDRRESPLFGDLTYKVRALIESGEASDSECSGEVKLRHTGFSIAGVLDNMIKPQFVQTADVTGDGVEDIIGLSTVGDHITVVPLKPDLRSEDIRIYTTDDQVNFPLADHESGIRFADVTGDGINDILSIKSGTFTIIPGGESLPPSGLVTAVGRRYTAINNELDEVFTEILFGDVNKDGVADIVGAHSFGSVDSKTQNGVVFVIPGGASLPASGTLQDNGISYYFGDGNSHKFGSNLKLADVTGDGYPDIISHDGASNIAGSSRGAIWVIPSNGTLPANGGALAAGNRYVGDVNFARLGNVFNVDVYFMDMNKDGILDMVSVSGQTGASYQGAIYIILGASTLPADGVITTVGIKYTGDFAQDYLGLNPHIADVNEDGFDDLVLASPLADVGGTNRGSVYILTANSALPGSNTFSNLTNIGFRYNGSIDEGKLGNKIIIGDVTNDDNDDILISAVTSYNSLNNSGSVYVFEGSSALAASGSIDSATIRRYDGEVANSYLVPAGILDMTGDGRNEIVLMTSSMIGSLHLIEGQASLPASDKIEVVGYTYSKGLEPWNFSSISYTEDVTGDGRPDLIKVFGNGSTSGYSQNGHVLVFPSSSTLPASQPLENIVYFYEGAEDDYHLGYNGWDDSFIFEDITGDGALEMRCTYSTYWHSYLQASRGKPVDSFISDSGLSLGNGTVNAIHGSTGISVSNGHQIVSLVTENGAQHVYSDLVLNGSVTTTKRKQVLSESKGDKVGTYLFKLDFDQDGKKDLIFLDPDASSHGFSNNGQITIIPSYMMSRIH